MDYSVLYSLIAGLVSADTDRIFDRKNEDLSISDLSCLCGFDDCCHGSSHGTVCKNDLQLDLGQEIDRIFAAAVDLRVALLATEALDFSYGHAFDSQLAERVFDLFKFEGFDDCFDFFHD